MAQTQRAAAASASPRGNSWGVSPELTVMHARQLNDAHAVIDLVRGNATVVLNVAAIEPALRLRLVDIVAGGLCAIDASATEVGNNVWLLKPLLAR